MSTLSVICPISPSFISDLIWRPWGCTTLSNLFPLLSLPTYPTHPSEVPPPSSTRPGSPWLDFLNLSISCLYPRFVSVHYGRCFCHRTLTPFYTCTGFALQKWCLVPLCSLHPTSSDYSPVFVSPEIHDTQRFVSLHLLQSCTESFRFRPPYYWLS